MKYLLILLLLVVETSQAEVLRIGVLLDLSKVYAPQGQAFQRGIELAAKQINSERADTVEVFFEDTQFDAKAAITAAQRLIAQRKVVALFTMSATEQKAVSLMAKNHKIPTVALWDSSPEIEAIGEYSFGFGPWTPATGETSAKFAFQGLNLKAAYIVTQQDEWSEHLGDYFKAEFEKLGGRVVSYDKLDPKNTDFRSTITKIKSSSADVVFAPLPINISQFFKQAKQQSIVQKIIAADVLTDEEIQNSQGAAEGIYHIEASAPDQEISKALYENYFKQYGSECKLKPFLTWGYDAVLILAASWNRANQTGGKVFAEQIRATKNLETANGKISVSEKGSVPKFPAAHQVIDGKLILLRKQ
jgi:branched-chain amino acid transport system substrate-binding protein